VRLLVPHSNCKQLMLRQSVDACCDRGRDRGRDRGQDVPDLHGGMLHAPETPRRRLTRALV